MAVKKATKSFDETNTDLLKISFTTGQDLEVSLAEIPPEIVHRLALHGLSQKVGDSYAGCEVDEAFDKASAVVSDLKEGNWSTRVATGGSPRSTQLAQALADATGKTLDEAAAVLEPMDDEQKKDLRKHPQIKACLAQIRAAKAAADAEKAAGEAVDAPSLAL